jgi:hypothetical protein
METAISQLTVLPATKEEVALFAEKLRQELLSGNYNALDLFITRKRLDQVFDIVKDDLNKLAFDEAEKYGEKKFDYKGVKIERSSTSKYDYKNCNHPEYNQLLKRKTELEEFFKTIKIPMQIADESTGGEQIVINPPIKSTTDFLKIATK